MGLGVVGSGAQWSLTQRRTVLLSSAEWVVGLIADDPVLDPPLVLRRNVVSHRCGVHRSSRAAVPQPVAGQSPPTPAEHRPECW